MVNSEVYTREGLVHIDESVLERVEACIREGLSGAQTARKLSISERSVRKYKKHCYDLGILPARTATVNHDRSN